MTPPLCNDAREQGVFGEADVAAGKTARQSSISPWSFGATETEDASRAIIGAAPVPYGFHTSREVHPWWAVDLGGNHHVSCISITNRGNDIALVKRAAPLKVEISDDGTIWRKLFETAATDLFGVYNEPLTWLSGAPVLFRFLRITLLREETLHLDRVQIFGKTVAASETPEQRFAHALG